MKDKVERILDDFLNKTLQLDLENPFLNQNSFKKDFENYQSIYQEIEERFIDFCAYFHYKINSLFSFWNSKYNVSYGGHFNAEESRELIKLINDFYETQNELKKNGILISLINDYLILIERIIPLLNNSGGSPIPVEFGKIQIIKYESIFVFQNQTVLTPLVSRICEVTLIGEGSYAIVHKYFDPFYNRFFVTKQIKSGFTEKELARFKNEYNILSNIKYPYIIEVFSYNEEKNSYTMEFCNYSLKEYISKNNQKLNFSTRKKIALQFLYGVNFLYKKNYFHRDLSYKNILIKEYDDNVFVTKISDFGLIKDPSCDLTSFDTSNKGSTCHIDPLLKSFSDIKIENEVYSIGYLLNFIFTGRENLSKKPQNPELNKIIEKCTDNKKIENRYNNIVDIIKDLKKIN